MGTLISGARRILAIPKGCVPRALVDTVQALASLRKVDLSVGLRDLLWDIRRHLLIHLHVRPQIPLSKEVCGSAHHHVPLHRSMSNMLRVLHHLCQVIQVIIPRLDLDSHSGMVRPAPCPLCRVHPRDRSYPLLS